MTRTTLLAQSLKILADLGMPQAQRNERTALCLLALLDLTPNKTWAQASAPLIGITPIMDWARVHYEKDYAPNTRETVRRQSIHQFVQAGICLYNPDNPQRPVNSPGAVYQISPQVLDVLKTFGTDAYPSALARLLVNQPALAEQYARVREMNLVPVRVRDGLEIKLSVGSHSELIKAIVEDYGPRFAPGAELIYVGDTGNKTGLLDADRFLQLGISLDQHGKFPDVVMYDAQRNWLFLIESVTSHGPVDHKRRTELEVLFKASTAPLVFVSAFRTRRDFGKYHEQIAWETEVWVADTPSHMVHFNGDKFLGPA